MVKLLLILSILSTATSSLALDIIQIGDSQSQGIFGRLWNQKINSKRKYSLNIYARGGSTAASWVDYTKSKGNFRHYNPSLLASMINLDKMLPFKSLLEKSKARAIIIQLGGNMVWHSDETIYREVKDIVSLIKNTTDMNCIWIGPPNGHKRPVPRFAEFYQILKTAVEVEGCKFIDSRPYSTYPTGLGDGIHYDSLPISLRVPLVTKWINGIYKKVKRDLR